MRKSPYSNHSHSGVEPQGTKGRQSSDFAFQPGYKQDLNKMYGNIVAYLPSPGRNNPQYLLYHRNNKIGTKRPLTVNRTQSQLKNKGDDHQPTGQTNRELWVSTLKDSKLAIATKDNDHSKGRVYRGMSWKLQDRPKIQAKDSTRYSYTSRLRNNLTPTPKQEASSARQSFRASGVYDLIEKNLKSKDGRRNKIDDDFFQYVMRFSYRTKKGSVPSNPNKVNQDSFIINTNIQNKTYQHFFAICDGHGPLGHHVSSFIKNALPAAVLNSKGLQKNPHQALMRAFEVAYQQLLKESNVDLTFSGSTVIATYLLKDRLFCCNVGDSRAIIGQYKQKEKKWDAIALSEDHKPSLQKEAERIKKMNGRIEPYRDEHGEEIGPLRVWIKNEHVPGLAMTRSFGDLLGASVGVSAIPEIKQFELSQDDRIVLIASDGVFEFLDNKRIIEEVSVFYQKKQIQQASDHLLGLAHRSWTQNSSIIDDITFILIFLNYNQVSIDCS